MNTIKTIKVKSLKQLSRIKSIDNPTILDLTQLKESKLSKECFPRSKVGLVKIIFQNSLEYIDTRLCENAINLETVENLPMLKFIGDEAFLNCSKLVSFPFSPSINYIGVSAFQFCTSLKGISLWNVPLVSKSCFDYCNSVEKIVMYGVKVIDHHAFACNLKLKEIYLPETVEKISNLAFQAGINTERLTSMASVPPQICQESFTCCSFKKILVKKESLELYKTAKNWEKYSSIMVGFDDTSIEEVIK